MALSAGQNWAQRLAALLFGVRHMQDGGTLLVDGEGQPREYDTLNAVAPLRAYANPSESRFDLEIEPTALDPDVPTARTAYVDGVNGHDTGDSIGIVGNRNRPFLTPGAAIAAVIIAGPSASAPYLIQIHPGTYDMEPTVLPSYVIISSSDGPSSVILQASTADDALLTMQPSSRLKGIGIRGANGSGGVGVLIPYTSADATERPQIERCVFRDCETCVRVTGSGASVFLWRCEAQCIDGESIEVAYEAVSGGLMLGRENNAEGAASPLAQIGTGFRCDGSGSELLVAEAFMVLCGNGFYASNGGRMVTASSAYRACSYAVRIAASGGTIDHGPSEIENSLVEDVLVESSSGRIDFNNVVVDKRPNIAAGAAVFGTVLDRERRVLVHEGTVCAGTPDRPAVLAAGQGCATVDGMAAQWRLVGTPDVWTDVTDELVSESGSIINAVPGTATGSYLYIGGDLPCDGLLLDCALARTGGAMIWEYWDGALWQPVAWMTAEASPPYAPSANAMLTAAVLQNVRFGARTGQAASTENAKLKYWYRLSVTSALTVIPRLESAKLHYAYTRLGINGVIEHFGNGEPYGYLDVDMSQWRAGSGTAPQTTVVSYSASVSRTSPAAYQANADRELGYDLELPPDVDTSRPIELLLEWYCTTTSTGTARFELVYVPVPSASTLNGGLAGQQILSLAPVGNGTIGLTQIATATVSAPGLVSGSGRVGLTLRRLALTGPDTLAGVLVISKARLRYRRWRS